MLATASIPGLGPQAMPSGDGDDLSAFASQIMTSSGSVSPPTSPHSSASLTLHASATATPVTDMELTNLGWLQKPGVLSSMCTALGDGPQQQQQLQHSKMGAPVRRRPRQPKSNESRRESAVSRSSRSSDKMVNVILNARNRKYDGGDVIKPPLSFACMIFMAVESSPTKTLPVKEIYDWVMWKFPYYQSAPPGWKNSVRHNLSLHKCFKKVERRYSLKSGSAVTKGGLWTVDPDYRRSLLSALKRTPYHPYHSYFTPPLSPSSSSSSLETVDPAERDAALTMCMISGSSEQLDGTPDLLHAVIHDHCYTKCPLLPVPSPPDSPCPQVTVKLNTGGRSRRKSNKRGLTLDEIAAAAELILAQDDADDNQETSGSESSDEGFGGEVESDSEEDPVTNSTVEDLADSGYGAGTATPTNTMELSSALDEMGADALLCLATGTKSTS